MAITTEKAREAGMRGSRVLGTYGADTFGGELPDAQKELTHMLADLIVTQEGMGGMIDFEAAVAQARTDAALLLAGE